MTPDEMKVLARVANRNAIEDSPVVIENARGIQPINNELGEAQTVADLDRRLDILEDIQDKGIQKVNELEARLGVVVAANDTPVKVLAEVVAQTKLDVADLKTVRDTLRLNPADVLTGVIKPTRLGSVASLAHNTFQIVGTNGSKIDGTALAADRTGDVKIRVFKDLETRPQNIRNLDSYGSAGTVLTKVSGVPSSIDGFVKIASNTGIQEIDLTDKDFDSSDIRNIEINPRTTNAVYEVPAVNTIDVYDSQTQIGGAKTISVSSLAYNGHFTTNTGAPQSAPAGYIFVTDTSSGRYFLWTHTQSAAYTAVTSTTEFTQAAVVNGQAVDVLLAGTSGKGVLIGLKYTSTAVGGSNYYYNGPSQFDSSFGAIHLVENIATAVGANGVRDMYIIKPSVKVTPAYNSHQQIELIRPASDEYYRIGTIEKYAKCSGITGKIELDIAAAGVTTYLIDQGQIYAQDAGFADNRVKLDVHEWLFNTLTRKFITNISASAQGFVPAGYYKLNDKLVKMDGVGNVVFDRTKGEVILYKFKNNKNFKLTVPNITPTSTLTEILEPNFTIVTQVSEELFIGEDFKLRAQNQSVVTDRTGLRFVFGDENFPRANKLYSIGADGLCAPYSGLAYLQIEEDTPTFAMRVWFTVTAGVMSQLTSGEYLNVDSKRVFKVGTSLPNGNYATGNIVDLAQSGVLPQIQKTRNALLLESTQVSVENLRRLSGEKLSNPTKYQTLGLIAGGLKSSMTDIALLGGIEVISSVTSTYNGKILRVMSGSDYEIVYITVSGNIAVANKTNPLINGSTKVQIASILYNIDIANNSKLVKVTSGYVFADNDEEKDIRAVKSDGTLESTLTATSDCLHFAWVDSIDSKKKVYWVDTTNANRLEPVENNTSYYHGTKNNGVYTNIVLLVKKPLTAYVAADEEDAVENASGYSMQLLDLASGTYKELPIPSADNNDSKGWLFRGDQFNSNEFKNLTSSSQRVYWHRDSGNNKPYINRIVTETSLDYNTDGFGLRSNIPMVINGKHFVGPDNILLYGVNGARVANNDASKNKYYIDYEGNLAKSSATSGNRAQIVTDNLFVVFADNDFRSRYYSNGRIVLVTPGSLIAVNSTAAAQSADHKYNGLKMWGKDATGMFNRWLTMESDSSRQSNNSNVGQIVDLFEADTATAAPFNALPTLNKIVVSNGRVISFVGATADLTAALALANEGRYAWDSTQAKVVKATVTTGVGSWVVEAAVAHYLVNAEKTTAASPADVADYSKIYITTGTGALDTSNNAIAANTLVLIASGNRFCAVASGANGKSASVPFSASVTTGNALTVVIPEEASATANFTDPTSGGATKYGYNTTDGKLYSANGGVGGTWGLIGADTIAYIKSNGNLVTFSGTSGVVKTTATYTQYNYFIADSIAYVLKNSIATGTGISPKSNNELLVAVNLDDSTTTNGANKLFQLDNAFSGYSIGSRDGSVVTINRNGGTAKLLVADGIAQDARAPRGTLVYTDSGVKIRTGLSQAQVAAGVTGNRGDTWA